MNNKGNHFYNPRGMSPLERAMFDNMRAKQEEYERRFEENEAAMCELADMAAAQDDALVEIAGIVDEIGG